MTRRFFVTWRNLGSPQEINTPELPSASSRADTDKPLAQAWQSVEPGFDGVHRFAGQFDTFFVQLRYQLYGGMLLVPRHPLRHFDNGFHRVQYTPPPVVLEGTKAAFDGIVLAMIRRIVQQREIELTLVREAYQAMHVLRAATLILWAVVLVDGQRTYPWTARLVVFPPVFHNIGETVRCPLGHDHVEEEFPCLHDQEPHGRHLSVGAKVVVQRADLNAAVASPGKVSDLDNVFRIERDAQRSGILVDRTMLYVQLLEDGIRLRDFLFRLALLHFPRSVSHPIEAKANALFLREFLVLILFLLNQLATYFSRRQTPIQAGGSESRVCLHLRLHDLTNVLLELGKPNLGRFSSSRAERVNARYARLQFM